MNLTPSNLRSNHSERLRGLGDGGTLSAGFSLPEVTMAVGIASMAIVLLLGLVPAGVSAIRDASVTLSESRIIQQIAGEIQGANWGEGTGAASTYTLLSKYNGTKRYYDDQGTPLESGGENSIRLGYVARIRLDAEGANNAVPGGAPSNNMAAVTVDVASVPNPNFNFEGDAPYKSRTLLITRQY
jgi:uncharacterized protein (TIGR02598 family)